MPFAGMVLLGAGLRDEDVGNDDGDELLPIDFMKVAQNMRGRNVIQIQPRLRWQYYSRRFSQGNVSKLLSIGDRLFRGCTSWLLLLLSTGEEWAWTFILYRSAALLLVPLIDIIIDSNSENYHYAMQMQRDHKQRLLSALERPFNDIWEGNSRLYLQRRITRRICFISKPDTCLRPETEKSIVLKSGDLRSLRFYKICCNVWWRTCHLNTSRNAERDRNTCPEVGALIKI